MHAETKFELIKYVYWKLKGKFLFKISTEEKSPKK